MKHIDSDPLRRALAALMREIGCAADDLLNLSEHDEQAKPMANIAAVERCAKAVSQCMKTMGEIETHNRQVAANSDSEKYIAYEDLPPPNPSERQRVIERVLALAARFETGAGLSKTGGAGSSQ